MIFLQATLWIRNRCLEVIPLGATLWLLTACQESCPSGYTIKDYLCVLSVDSGVIDGTNAEDSGRHVDTDAALTECADATFGSVCLTDADCGCDTGFCAAMPGQKGFCTHSGCLQDSAVCPSGWTCTDLSSYGQQGLSICTPP